MKTISMTAGIREEQSLGIHTVSNDGYYFFKIIGWNPKQDARFDGPNEVSTNGYEKYDLGRYQCVICMDGFTSISRVR